MAYEAPKAPNVNGTMVLTEEETTTIRTKLETIQTGFVPTEEQPVLDLFYIVATYNRENPDFVINGDTASLVLGGAISIEPEPEPTTIEADIVG